ncbi:MAG: hypothetical protein K5892_04080 [Acholeplasmatales bacterium]|nr:hypothetical protein [Acholeplasmatales bacterium]
MLKQTELINKKDFINLFDGIENQINNIWNYAVDILFKKVKDESIDKLNYIDSKEEYLRNYYTNDYFYDEITQIIGDMLNYYFCEIKKDKKISNNYKNTDILFPYKYECNRIPLSLEYSILSNFDLDNKIIIDFTDNPKEIKKQISKLKDYQPLGMVSKSYGIYTEYFKMDNGCLLAFKCVSSNNYYVREMIIFNKKRG